jgi:hypothetical protein
MAGVTRVFGGSVSRPGKIKVIMLTAALVFLGLMGGTIDAAGQGLGTIQSSPQQNPRENRIPPITPSDFPKPNEKQKQAIVDYNFKKLKKHAADLADLAKSLQKEIEKSNENVLSLEIVKKADEVEKLAKKIKNEAKGY